jgi:hypothetical protein
MLKIFKLEISNRLILGFLMLGFGAIVAYSGVYNASYGPNGTRVHVYVSPGPLHPFWLPISYDVMRVPDYSFTILTMGVIIATTGFWIAVFDIYRRRARIE